MHCRPVSAMMKVGVTGSRSPPPDKFIKIICIFQYKCSFPTKNPLDAMLLRRVIKLRVQ